MSAKSHKHDRKLVRAVREYVRDEMRRMKADDKYRRASWETRFECVHRFTHHRVLSALLTIHREAEKRRKY